MIKISVFKNWPLKIAALFLAVILWLYVMSDQNPPVETSITVPLEVHNLSEGMVITDFPETVKVSIKTNRGRLADIDDNDIRAYIDVTGLGEGRHTLRVKTIAPPKVEVSEVNPERVTFHIDESGKRTINLEIQFVGNNNTSNLKADANIKQIMIFGPNTLLQTVYRAVLYVDPTNQPISYKTQIEPTLLNFEGKEIDGLKTQPARVDVQVSGNDFTRRQLKVSPQLVGNSAQTVQSVQCDPAQVWLSGQQSVLKTITNGVVATEPIDINGMSGTKTFDAKLVVPNGLKSDVAIVRVTIEF